MVNARVNKTLNFMNKLIISLLILFTLSCKAQHEELKRPNILFAISDDQSYAHTSFSGCNFIETPAFDRIAQEGIYFSNCYAGSPGCAPSRSAIVTGRYPWQNEQAGQHSSYWMKKYVPFIDELTNNGYAAGRTGKGVEPFKYRSKKASTENILWRKGNAAGSTHSNIIYEKENDKRTAKGIAPYNYTADFKYFVQHIAHDSPFFFWYGSKEPHRRYEKGSWKRTDKKLTDVEVPPFLPDNDVIRGDLLDYAVEVEWFDKHLMQMLHYLDSIGELENTVVIVTSDNGMPFPRAKANCYEFGSHVPFAIMYPKQFLGGRIVNSPASFIDIAPTILELAQVEPTQMMPIYGKSMLPLLENKLENSDNVRKYACSGRERHSSSRYNNLGYPQRVIRKDNYLMIWNMKPKRWPAGAPQIYDTKDTSNLLPLYKGRSFADVDSSPSKSYILKNGEEPEATHYFELAFNKRPEFELYDVESDYACVNNLWGVNQHKKTGETLRKELLKELTRSQDPRIVGPDKEIFDSYNSYRRVRKFPKTENSEIN